MPAAVAVDADTSATIAAAASHCCCVTIAQSRRSVCSVADVLTVTPLLWMRSTVDEFDERD